jgi:SAM-dependent methyltransferase
MSFYERCLLPYCIDWTCGMQAFAEERRKVCAELSGTVLEIGFGSGLNLPHLPAAVTRLLAVDPSQQGRHIARKRLARASCEVQFIGLDAERLAAEDESVDAALCTFTLCTIPHVDQALREVRRILKPGKKLYFLEHGRAPDAKIARRQDRLNGLQRAIAGGCNLNRDIAKLVSDAGFALEAVEAGYFPKTPKTHGFLLRGSASSNT